VVILELLAVLILHRRVDDLAVAGCGERQAHDEGDNPTAHDERVYPAMRLSDHRKRNRYPSISRRWRSACPLSPDRRNVLRGFTCPPVNSICPGLIPSQSASTAITAWFAFPFSG